MSVKEMVERHGTFNRMFEFHHVDPKTKHSEYNDLMKRVLSPEQIEEVDKCTLLCTQCHGIIHAQNIKGDLELTVTFDGRTISQKFKGWIIYDAKDNKATFVTNQRFMLQPCEVRFGTRGPVKLCVIEIEQEHNLLNWLKNLEDLKTVEILACSNAKTLMKIEHVSTKKVKITQALGFPVTAIDASFKGNGIDDLWVRNGVALSKTGEVLTSGTFSYICELLL
jgi:hypothetical protein